MKVLESAHMTRWKLIDSAVCEAELQEHVAISRDAQQLAKRHTITDKIHDKDAPLNGPLLNNDDGASPLFLRNLDQIHWNLGRRDTNTDTVDEATDNQHANTVTACLYGGTKQPPEAGKGDGITTSDAVGYRTSHDCTNHGTSGERGTDATLSSTGWIVEVLHILVRPDDGGNRRNVEPKASTYEQGFSGKKRKVRHSQHTTKRGNGSDEVDIVNLWHLHHGQDQEVTEALGRMSQLMRVSPNKGG